jgi:hypothetical protein
MTSPLRLAAYLVASLSVAVAQPAPSATPAYVPKQSDRPAPLEGDEPGFRPIFDGRTLDGWSGDPVYWRVEDGAIVGEITPETVVRSNTFLIWQGGEPEDFELKLEYRITAQGNSGINYRSVSVPDPVTPTNAFALRGYQFDLDGRNRYTGNNYEEKGRLFLAERGQITRVTGERPPIVVATTGGGAAGGRDGWNEVHVIARGSTLIHVLNGGVACVVFDDDEKHRPERGKIGVQVHTGPPMKVEFRRIRLKTPAADTR